VIRVFKIWACRCTDGRFWAERPRHVTCADCSALIMERQCITIQDALSYSNESIRDARNQTL
jgi:hypothetical protein